MNTFIDCWVPSQGTSIALSEKIDCLKLKHDNVGAEAGAPQGANRIQFLTRTCLAFLLTLCLWGTASACDTTFTNLAEFPFSATVTALDESSGYDWEIALYLGDTSESVKDFLAIELDLDLSRSLDVGAAASADMDTGWPANGGSYTNSVTLEQSRSVIHLEVSLSSCSTSTGDGYIGSIFISGDDNSRSLLVDDDGGVVMQDNADGLKWAGTSPATAATGHLYPNPARGSFAVDYRDADLAGVSLRSAKGQLLRRWEQVGNGQSLDVSGFANGLHFVELQFRDGTRETHRLVVQQ